MSETATQATEHATQAWLKSGEYLPPDLRDFHDQKLFFKWLVWKKMGPKEADPYLKGLNFVNVQIAVIDYFLWFMARCGYTLQRSRKKGVQFASLEATMRAYDTELCAQQAASLSEILTPAESPDA